METEYRTMPDLFAGAVYEDFVFLVHHICLTHNEKREFQPRFLSHDRGVNTALHHPVTGPPSRTKRPSGQPSLQQKINGNVCNGPDSCP